MPLPLLTMSLMEGQEVIDSDKGQMIVLPCKVEGLTITTIGDPNVLTKCLPALPGLYASHPDTVNFPNATLRERRIRSVKSPNIAFVDLIYRTGFGLANFILEDITQTEYLHTLTTADGSQTLGTWFKPGQTNFFNSSIFIPPSGVTVQTPPGVMKFQPKRILKASGWMKYADWKKVRAEIRSIKVSINSVPWGDDPVEDDRGNWLFGTLVTRTEDLNATKIIELYFLQDPRGWYPISVNLGPDGLPVNGGTTESQLRAMGPPPVGGQWQMNGMSRHSVYLENDFNQYFTFDPSQA